MVTAGAEQTTMIIVPALFAGIIIGLYETFVVLKDLATHKMHAFHTFPFAVIFTFISFNVKWALQTFSFLNSIPILGSEWGIRVLLFLIAVIKLHASSMIVHGSTGGMQGMGERWTHSLIVGALIVAAPFIWPYLNPFLPDWAKVPVPATK